MVGEGDVRQTTCDPLLPPCGEKGVLQMTDFICIQVQFTYQKTQTSQSAGTPKFGLYLFICEVLEEKSRRVIIQTIFIFILLAFS